MYKHEQVYGHVDPTPKSPAHGSFSFRRYPTSKWNVTELYLFILSLIRVLSCVQDFFLYLWWQESKQSEGETHNHPPIAVRPSHIQPQMNTNAGILTQLYGQYEQYRFVHKV